jgi:hypothetical protein
MTDPSTMPLWALCRRGYNSAVVWMWGHNFLRLASGLLLLPLVCRLLPKPDLGMYYLFLSISGLAVMLDFGFSGTIMRFVTYAMGGATRLSAEGVANEQCLDGPNYPLLWELLHTCRVLFRFLALVALVLLGGIGSVFVGYCVDETSQPLFTWVAWAVNILAAASDLYFGLWALYLRSMNQVLAVSRLTTLAYALRLVLACGLLLGGAGLMSLPAATLCGAVLVRWFSKTMCLAQFPPLPPPAKRIWLTQLRIVWPNSWRLGTVLIGSSLAGSVNVMICSSVLGLTANADYGLSLQVATISQSLASVWTLVRWPIIGQQLARQDYAAVRRTIWPRVWLQLLSHGLLVMAAVGLGPVLLTLIRTDKQLLPAGWFALVMINAFLDMQCTLWNTLISMTNRLPMMWSYVITNTTAILLGLVLIHQTRLGVGALVLGPFLAGVAFNYWYWPRVGARMLDAGWLRFMVTRTAP